MPRKASRMFDTSRSKQPPLTEELMEEVADLYYGETQVEGEQHSMIPFLQASKATRAAGLKALYRTIRIGTEAQLIGFLTLPAASSYFLVQSIMVDFDSDTIDDDRVYKLVQKVKAKTSKVPESAKLGRWLEIECDAPRGKTKRDGTIDDVEIWAQQGTLSTVTDLCQIYFPSVVRINYLDLIDLDTSMDFAFSAEQVVLWVPEAMEEGIIEAERDDGTALTLFPSDDVPPTEEISEVFRSIDEWLLPLDVWPLDHPRDFVLKKAEDAKHLLLHLASIEDTIAVIIECEDQHFFCNHDNGHSHVHPKLKLMGCAPGCCPLEGKKHPHPYAADIAKIFRGEKVKTKRELELEADAELAKPGPKRNRVTKGRAG